MKSSKPWLYSAARAFDAMAGFAVGRTVRPAPPDPERILVSNIGHLGDALLTLGVPGVLRHAFPDAAIDVLTSTAGARLFVRHPNVDRVFTHDALLLGRTPQSRRRSDAGDGTRRSGTGATAVRSLVAALQNRRYDIALELRSYVPNSILLLARSRAAFLCGFGTAGFSFLLDRVVPHVDGEHELVRFGRVIEAVTGSPLAEPPVPELGHLFSTDNAKPHLRTPYTVLHPGTRRRRKRWEPERWRHLAASLADAGEEIVVTGAAEERPWLESTFRSVPARILAGSLDVPALAQLYGASAAFVGVDSFPAHLAAAAGAPRVVVLWHDFADPAEWAPVGAGRVAVLPGAATHDVVLEAIAETA